MVHKAIQIKVWKYKWFMQLSPGSPPGMMLLLLCVIGYDSQSCFTHQRWGKTRQESNKNSLDFAGNPIKPIANFSDTTVVPQL